MKYKFALLGNVFIFFLLIFFCASPLFAQQQWQPPLEKADLLLFSAHADDEHLFFAGILPFCVANGINAQVVYMTEHYYEPVRRNERLEGLWAVGIRNEPVVAEFPDLYSESYDEALRVYAQRGYSEDDFVAFCVENIRRFRPSVVAGHDINGEYSHGGHILSSRALMRAVILAADENYHTESALVYGVWDTPKTYINLWPERQITLDIDTPLDYFDGKTAFQVSQEGFSFHKSQHWTWFYGWLYGTAASPKTSSPQIENPPLGKFGLYRTLADDDSLNAGHFFENVPLAKDLSADAIDITEEHFDLADAGTVFTDSDSEGDSQRRILSKRMIFSIIFLFSAGLIIFIVIKFWEPLKTRKIKYFRALFKKERN